MCSIRDGPVDLVGGGGGVVEEFVRAPKGHKKDLHTQHCKKKNLQSKTSNVVIVQSIQFEYFQKKSYYKKKLHGTCPEKRFADLL